MRILVTGGAGFIGSHLCERLVERGDRVAILDDFNDFYPPALKRRNVESIRARGDVELVEGDLRDRAAVARAFDAAAGEAGGPVDMVVHLAARAGVRPSLEQPLLYEQVNGLGTLHVLEELRERGCTAWVFGSSSSVYGCNEKTPFSEDDPVDRPASPYAATKKAGELYAANYHHLYGIRCAALRFFTVYGPRQRPEMAIHKFTRRVDQGRPVPMFGDGTSRRDYTYVDDIIQGVLAAVDRTAAGDLDFEVINLGESETTELRRLIALIGDGLGVEPVIETLPEQPGDVPVTFADVSKAAKLLGYKPVVPVADGLPRFLDWYREVGRDVVNPALEAVESPR